MTIATDGAGELVIAIVAASIACVRWMRRPRYLSKSSVASSANDISNRPAPSSAQLVERRGNISRARCGFTAANNGPWFADDVVQRARGRGVKRASHAPQSTRASLCCFENSCSSAVLPMPASPLSSAIQRRPDGAPKPFRQFGETLFTLEDFHRLRTREHVEQRRVALILTLGSSPDRVPQRVTVPNAFRLVIQSL